ncbi:MAG: FecR domain-containing protein [Ardenticatenaceae bacterium]|nr:FecR domain-containing protein [Ardenticatenaceae bacterium]
MGSGTAVQLHSRERLAWAFVLAGSIVFLGLIIAIPVLINLYIQQATESFTVAFEAQQGTVSIHDDNGVQRAILPGDEPQTFAAQASIRTGFPANGFVSLVPPDSGQLLARIQMFANTTLAVVQADSPRFAASDEAYVVGLNLENGRLQLKVLPEAERPFFITLTTPHGQLLIVDAGEYTLDVNDEETQVKVQAGQVAVTAVGGTITLLPNQRAELYALQAPVGPLVPQENLIANGNFRQPLLSPEAGWQKTDWNIELPDQPKGEIRQTQSINQSSLRLSRDGSGHADIHFEQPLDVPVTESAASLWLQLKFRIVGQSLEVCGFQGSECPLFVQLAYEDEDGNPYTWQQGFYILGSMNNTSPYACFSCAVVQSGHEQVVADEVAVYEINMAEIGRLGPIPQHLSRISLVASGHSFDVEILDVALFATAVE